MANELGGANMVKTVSTAEARANLGDVLNGVYYTHEPVIVQKKGKTMAVIISPDEYEAFRRDRDARAWATVEAMGERHAGEDPDAVLAEVTAIVEEVRRERYEQRPS
jgi:prevent-host-death family protein